MLGGDHGAIKTLAMTPLGYAAFPDIGGGLEKGCTGRCSPPGGPGTERLRKGLVSEPKSSWMAFYIGNYGRYESLAFKVVGSEVYELAWRRKKSVILTIV